jgi:hypothetical protein
LTTRIILTIRWRIVCCRNCNFDLYYVVSYCVFSVLDIFVCLYSRIYLIADALIYGKM